MWTIFNVRQKTPLGPLQQKLLPLQQEVKCKEAETSSTIDLGSCLKVFEKLRLSLSKSIEELKRVQKQIKLEEFALQVFANMVEEGKKKLLKANEEYTKFKVECERFGNYVAC
jgi:hypothetical protein